MDVNLRYYLRHGRSAIWHIGNARFSRSSKISLRPYQKAAPYTEYMMMKVIPPEAPVRAFLMIPDLGEAHQGEELNLFAGFNKFL